MSCFKLFFFIALNAKVKSSFISPIDYFSYVSNCYISKKINNSIDRICQTYIIQGMTLREFKDQNKMSYAKLAAMIGASHATIARHFCLPKTHKDRMIPSAKYMAAIMTVTDGAVTPNDFYRVD